MEDKIKEFKVIECKDHIYITDDKEDRGYYSSSDILSYLFDGVQAKETYKKNWFKLDKIPTKVEKKLPNKNVNIRYELKEGYTPSDLMPSVINLESLYDTEYSEIAGLYNRKYDTVEGGYEEIPFSIDVIYKKDDFEWIQKQYASNPDLISQIEFHPDLLQEAPCNITSEEMFNVIRNHVKANIDPTVAKITSDYDFRFEVQREITIAEPYSYTINKNSGTRRKPNWVTNWVRSKSVSILNLKRNRKDSPYSDNCRLAPSFFGKNQIDLENKINQYLDDLMREINKKYVECPHCKGWGVIEGEISNA